MRVNVEMDVLNAIKEALKSRNKSAVRIDLGGFG
ncbi:hypothetical protein EDD71_11057 [Fonticella tunisiensis]|uniref:Uncharacterized protein n=1 Tax=Fonticella tunisiensis TaxID=1096341 RepID=A0A4R7KP89_9CLOT|nr:hypothetical protein EDD71_11057 [Fonticella tunisiensis]